MHGGHHHEPSRHNARIDAFNLTLDHPLDWPAIATWLNWLVASRGEHLLRVKGVLNVKGRDGPIAIHAVRHLIHPPARLGEWPVGDPRTSRLVFVTRNWSRAAFESDLRALPGSGLA